MARTITLKLTGLAEKFIEEMEKQGLNEADVIAQGIGILEEIWRTNRVALVREDFQINARRYNDDEKVLEHYYHIQTPEMMKRQSSPTVPPDYNQYQENPYRNRFDTGRDLGETSQEAPLH